MSFASLMQILTPPLAPVASEGDWNVVTQELGIELPRDYKNFIKTYGVGAIGSFITIFSPFANQETLNFISQFKTQLEVIRVLLEDYEETCPYPLYPQASGLLPVGMSDNGDVIHWVTRGNPENWNIVVNESRSPEYESFECNLTDFLAGLLSGAIVCQAFPKDVFHLDRVFHSD